MSYTLTISGVPCSVRVDSGVIESQTGDGPHAEVSFHCDYGKRYDLVRALMGTAAGGGGAFVRTLPYAYPPSPNLYCLAIGRISGIKEGVDASGWLIYRKAIVEASFGIPTWQFQAGDPAGGGIDPSGQPWTTTTFNVSSDVLKPPRGGYRFVGSGTTGNPDGVVIEEGSLGIIFPQVEIRVRRHWCPYVPLAEMMAAVGRVNSNTVKFANYTFPAEHLLFAAGPTQQQADTLGGIVSEVEYLMLGRTKSWNQLPNKDGVWTDINTAEDGSGLKPFQSINFSTLPWIHPMHGRSFTRQKPGEEILHGTLNQTLGPVEGLLRLRAGAGLRQRTGPGGIPLLAADFPTGAVAYVDSGGPITAFNDGTKVPGTGTCRIWMRAGAPDTPIFDTGVDVTVFNMLDEVAAGTRIQLKIIGDDYWVDVAGGC